MSNLSQETIDRIRESASDKYNLSSEEGERIGYQVGSLYEAERARGLVLTLELINTWINECAGHGKLVDADKAIRAIDGTLAKYKEVVGNG